MGNEDSIKALEKLREAYENSSKNPEQIVRTVVIGESLPCQQLTAQTLERDLAAMTSERDALRTQLAYKQGILEGQNTELAYREESDIVQRTQIAFLETQLAERRVVVPELGEPVGVRGLDLPIWGIDPQTEESCRSCGNPVMAGFHHGIRKGYALAASRVRAVGPDEEVVPLSRLASLIGLLIAEGCDCEDPPDRRDEHTCFAGKVQQAVLGSMGDPIHTAADRCWRSNATLHKGGASPPTIGISGHREDIA